jgi:hypothetical protein
MCRQLSIVALIALLFAQHAFASPGPNSEASANTMSMPQTAKAQVLRAPDLLESKLVGRLYTLTYGGRELCELVGLAEAARFERVLAEFHQAFPEVMRQFEQSMYFEEIKRKFSRWVKESPELKSDDELANLCQTDYRLLKAYTDHKNDPEVVESVLRIKRILKH